MLKFSKRIYLKGRSKTADERIKEKKKKTE
jgi:hypothetical protein